MRACFKKLEGHALFYYSSDGHNSNIYLLFFVVQALAALVTVSL